MLISKGIKISTKKKIERLGFDAVHFDYAWSAIFSRER
jgi:hypothetical protein